MNKIFKYKDVMPEIYDAFPELDQKSLDKLILKGLYTMKSELYKGEELLIHAATSNLKPDYIPGWIKFYKNMTPEQYRGYIKRRDKKRDAS
jgi:hypothetical protein